MEDEEEKYGHKELMDSSRERIRLTKEKIRDSFLNIDFLYRIEKGPFYTELKGQIEKENGGGKIET